MAWHEKSDHPLTERVMHYIHIVCMILLAVSGFYIHKPAFAGRMDLWRNIHFYSMFIVTLNLVARLYWSLFGDPHDIRRFLPEKINRGTMLQMLLYYTFLRRTHPLTAKLNTLQKDSYDVWFILLAIQGLLGFSMYWHQRPFFAGIVGMLGGLNRVHLIHYGIMWVFIWTTMIHVYLSVFEDFNSFKLMFFGIESKEPR